jgi:hypothetical protein
MTSMSLIGGTRKLGYCPDASHVDLLGYRQSAARPYRRPAPA